MKKIGLVAFLALILTSCTKKETVSNPEFQGFAQEFAALSFPLNISSDREMEHNIHPLDPALAGRFLGTASADVIYAAGKVVGPGYVALLYYTEDEMEYAVTAAFFDEKGLRITSIVIQNATNEVADRFAFVQQTVWTEKGITRKIEYHSGNGGEDPSHYAEVTTTIAADGTITSTPEKITPEAPAMAETGPAGPYDVELVEYRSQDLPGYELYIAYPFDDAPVYLLSHDGDTRILGMNETGDQPDGGGVALLDNEFTGLTMAEETSSETTGISSFERITLIKDYHTLFTFTAAMVKRSLTIENTYAYRDGSATGSLSFSVTPDNTLAFKTDVNTGEPDFHICQLEGTMIYKANLAYYQGKPIDATQESDCKLLFLFGDKTVNVFNASGNFECGCGANATLQGEYKQP